LRAASFVFGVAGLFSGVVDLFSGLRICFFWVVTNFIGTAAGFIAIVTGIIAIVTGFIAPVTGFIAPVTGFIATVTGFTGTVTGFTATVTGFIAIVTSLIATVTGFSVTVAMIYGVAASFLSGWMRSLAFIKSNPLWNSDFRTAIDIAFAFAIFGILSAGSSSYRIQRVERTMPDGARQHRVFHTLGRSTYGTPRFASLHVVLSGRHVLRTLRIQSLQIRF
jgi:hypothetical protein